MNPEIDPTLVTVGQPVEGGCCWTCFDGSAALPTSAATKMAAPFLSLGDLSTNGFTEGRSISSTDHKSWHGSTVLSTIDDETNTFKMEFIEVNRVAVAKLRFGGDSVEEAADGSVARIAPKPGSIAPHPLVIDELESNGWLRRTVVPRAMVTSMDDAAHQKGSLLVYGMTFTALVDEFNIPFYVYRAKPAESGEEAA